MRLQRHYFSDEEACLQAARNFPQFRGSTEAEITAWLRKILARRDIAMFRHYKGTMQRDMPRDQAEIDLSAQTLARVRENPAWKS